MCGNAFALNIPGSALQGVLDGITVTGPSSVNVATDFIADINDSAWEITASGGSVATVVIELANFAENNIFGVYNGDEYVEIFGGSAVAGNQATLSMAANGDVYVNGTQKGHFSTTNFGYYLDSTYYGNGGLAHSNTADNADQLDHMFAYQGTGDTVRIDPWAAGTWTNNEYILAFEDLFVGPDWDFTDFVVMVESVQPVPEPATMLLLGLGLIGLAGVSRKKMMK